MASAESHPAGIKYGIAESHAKSPDTPRPRNQRPFRDEDNTHKRYSARQRVRAVSEPSGVSLTGTKAALARAIFLLRPNRRLTLRDKLVGSAASRRPKSTQSIYLEP